MLVSRKMAAAVRAIDRSTLAMGWGWRTSASFERRADLAITPGISAELAALGQTRAPNETRFPRPVRPSRAGYGSSGGIHGREKRTHQEEPRPPHQGRDEP